MNDYCASFAEYLKNNKKASENTQLSYLRDLQNYFSFLQDEDVDVLGAQEEVVQQYVERLHTLARSETTVSRNLATLHCFYKFLISQGICTQDPSRNVKPEKLHKAPPRFLTQEEIISLLQQPDVSTTKGCRDKAMLELLYATGIRVSELISLNVENVNLNRCMLLCRGARAERKIPIHPSAVVAVSDYLYRARKLLADAEDGPLFVNLNGGRLTRQGFWKIMKEYATVAGITAEITPHTLRHSFAVHLLQNGASLKDIQTMLGHMDISSTQVYTQVLENDRIKEVYMSSHPLAGQAK